MAKETMTPRERIIAAYEHRPVDRPPVMPAHMRWVRGRTKSTPTELAQFEMLENFGFDPMIYGGSHLSTYPVTNYYRYRPDGVDCYRDLPDVNVDSRTENYSDRTVHIRKFETPAGILTDRMEIPRPDMGFGDGPNPIRKEPLVKSLKDIDALKYIYSKPRAGSVKELQLLKKEIGDRGVVEFMQLDHFGGWGCEILGSAEEFFMCSIENPKLLKAVARVNQDHHLSCLKAVMEAGIKFVRIGWSQCGDSMGWSPDTFDEYFLPLIKESVDLVKSYGAYYRYQDDGKMKNLFRHLADINIDCISGLQPPPVGDCDFAELKQQWGEKFCLMGGVDGIYVMENGTPEDVYDAVKVLYDAAPDGTGIIVGNPEAFGPETPDENLHALINSAKDLWLNRA